MQDILRLKYRALTSQQDLPAIAVRVYTRVRMGLPDQLLSMFTLPGRALPDSRYRTCRASPDRASCLMFFAPWIASVTRHTREHDKVRADNHNDDPTPSSTSRRRRDRRSNMHMPCWNPRGHR